MISAGANSTAGVFPPGPTPSTTTSEPKSACRRAPSRTNPGPEAPAGGELEEVSTHQKKKGKRRPHLVRPHQAAHTRESPAVGRIYRNGGLTGALSGVGAQKLMRTRPAAAV